MRQRGYELVAQGVTSIEEVDRVLSQHGDAVADAPAKPAPGAPAPVVAPKPVSTAGTAKRKVLIADDDRMTRLVLRMMLERSGLRVIESASPIEACSMFEEDKARVDINQVQAVMGEIKKVMWWK